ncbi:uncharacterized protein LOC131939406 [Physella acuta]|uniref:uncharacterized protein LOC131939406 n=1 Tax=Physella acuta TaxID=109671 RepID=UPI0027DAEE03|nr:uncharacterized protein LOC131939406 [Physella acuta]
MSYTLTTIPEYRKVLLWYKDGQLMSECPVEAGVCSNNDINWIQAKVVKNDEDVQFILNIRNVTRDDSKNANGIWTLKTHTMEPTAQDVYSCVLNVYAKAENMTCLSDLSPERFSTSCFTSRIYPEAMMDVYRNGYQLQETSCENYKISENPLYYKATCKVIIRTEDMYLKRNDLTISIFPNVIGFRKKNILGTTQFIALQIAPEYVTMQNCAEEGNGLKCSCKRQDSRKRFSNFDWFMNSRMVKQESDVYTFTNKLSSALTIPNACPTDCDNGALIAVSTILAISILLITAHLVYKKKCKPDTDASEEFR